MGHDLDDDELRATRELHKPDKIKIRKALNKIYVYEADALINADVTTLDVLQDLEKILKGK
jgi:hypothetical protein